MFSYLKQGRGFYKQAILFMLPIMLQNLISHTLGLCDNFMVGYLGEAELAAMTAAFTPFFVLMIFCFGIQSGAGVLVAQYNGKGDTRAINRIMGVALYTTLIVTIAVALLSAWAPLGIMRLLTNNAALVPLGAQYVRVIGFAYIFAGVSGLYVAVQRSMGNPKLGAYIIGASGLLNIFLNWLLIYGKWGAPELGIAGAAWATLICRILEVVAVAVYAQHNPRLVLNARLILKPGALIFEDFIRFALPVMLNELLWSIGTSMYMIILGHMDGSTAILAAAAIAGNVERILSVAIFASAASAALIIGREIGLGADKESVYSKGVALNALSLGSGVLVSLLMLPATFLVAEPLIYPLLKLTPEASAICTMMLLMTALVVPCRAFACCNVVGLFRGGGDVRFALCLDVLPLYLFTVPVSFFAAIVCGAPIAVVYVLMICDDVIKTGFSLWRLKSRKWINDVTRLLD